MIATITLTLFFITLILRIFQRNLKRHIFFDYNDVNFSARLSLFKQYAIFENNVIKDWIKLVFFLENKLYDRKESSLTKCYCIRSKLTVLKKFLMFPFKTVKRKQPLKSKDSVKISLRSMKNLKAKMK